MNIYLTKVTITVNRGTDAETVKFVWTPWWVKLVKLLKFNSAGVSLRDVIPRERQNICDSVILKKVPMMCLMMQTFPPANTS